MAKTPPNHRRPWSATDEQRLEKLADGNTPTRVIGLKLGRTPDAVRQRAYEDGLSLKPTNQSPCRLGEPATS